MLVLLHGHLRRTQRRQLSASIHVLMCNWIENEERENRGEKKEKENGE